MNSSHLDNKLPTYLPTYLPTDERRQLIGNRYKTIESELTINEREWTKYYVFYYFVQLLVSGFAN